jgi:hypothetical protein
MKKLFFITLLFSPLFAFGSFDVDFLDRQPASDIINNNFYIDLKLSNYVNEYCSDPQYFAVSWFNDSYTDTTDPFIISNAVNISGVNKLNRFRFSNAKVFEYTDFQLSFFETYNDYLLSKTGFYGDDAHSCESWNNYSYTFDWGIIAGGFTTKQSILSINDASTTAPLAIVGELFGDLWYIIAIVVGIPLGFFMMSRVRDLFIA